MARELPIHNGRLTTDLNADGHLILNLRGGTLQVQSDWNQTDATAPDFIKNKPTIPTVPSAYTGTPEMDGTASAGSSAAWAKGDHVHPSDTSKQDALSAAQLANIAAVPGKANTSDLPYAMVTPGEWEFSGLPSGATDVAMSWNGSRFAWVLEFEVGGISNTMEGMSFSGENALSVHLENEVYTIIATRPSLPGHLCDRAGNRVVVSGDTTLTLPAANPGYLRDFLVRLEISGSTVPTITFAAPTGETLTYETDGDEFPVPDKAGNWLYSFTETKAGVFAVALKSVTTVAQGGS